MTDEDARKLLELKIYEAIKNEESVDDIKAVVDKSIERLLSQIHSDKKNYEVVDLQYDKETNELLVVVRDKRPVYQFEIIIKPSEEK